MAISSTDVVTERLLQATTTPMCTRIEPGELLRLHLHAQTIHVVSGCAWITWEGEDVLLMTGQEKEFGSSKYPALISAEQHSPLQIEIVPSVPGRPCADVERAVRTSFDLPLPAMSEPA
ncbi:MAG: hypothetical protein ACLQUY_18605 [Ktedonobacterales bacterium]